jgi:hypothetical protein
MHRKVAAALVAALALGAAGCGGAEPLTRAQLVRRIETACAQGQRATQRRLKTTRGSTEESQKRFIAAVVVGQRAIVDGIEDLDAPDSAKDTFDAFKQAISERTDVFDRLQSGSMAEIRRKVSTAQPQTEVLTGRMAQAARELGVDGCI